MKTALYVFLAILAAYAVISIFERIVAFVKRIKRITVKTTPYNGYQSSYNYSDSDVWRLRQMQERTEVVLDKLDDLLEKIDQIEDGNVNDSKND